MLNLILVGVAATVIAGGFSYWLSNKFWSSAYSKTNKSGDFGSPRGGVFATLSGSLIGLLLFAHVGKYFLTPDEVGVGMITSLIAGALFGFLPLFLTKRQPPADGDKK
ncbi:MAG: hypothetical protein IAF58_08835 [Leptolyngbya sp.]|nr:hypothetical protein [Candidatus Melainabacteria bacterium]